VLSITCNGDEATQTLVYFDGEDCDTLAWIVTEDLSNLNFSGGCCDPGAVEITAVCNYLVNCCPDGGFFFGLVARRLYLTLSNVVSDCDNVPTDIVLDYTEGFGSPTWLACVDVGGGCFLRFALDCSSTTFNLNGNTGSNSSCSPLVVTGSGVSITGNTACDLTGTDCCSLTADWVVTE
jgi:hypothetical protein